MNDINTIKKILKFTLGFTLILSGIFNNPNSIIISIIYIIIGLIILPMSYDFFIKQFKLNIKSTFKWTAIVLLYILSIYISTKEKEIRTIESRKMLEISNSKSTELARKTLSKMTIDELNNINKSTYFEEKKLNDNFKILLNKYRPDYINQWKIKDSLKKINHLKELEAERRWKMSKAGKLQKRHPNWSNEDCENIIKGLIWIGMDYDMVTYQRGLPNRINTSNYGNGNEYQACWDDYNPSCFYFAENGIIKSYN